MEDEERRSLARRLMGAGLAKSHAYQLASKVPTVPTAIRIFRRTGIKIGPIADASDEEIATLEKFEDRRADAVSP